MSETMGPISFPDEDRNSREFGRRPYSKRLANTMDDEARNIIARAYKRTESILLQHRHMLEKVLTCMKMSTVNNASLIDVNCI
jgi:spastic paraplegia protein 7